MTRLRIAMIGQRGLPATYGGVERHVEELGATLASLGHDVNVYCRSGYAWPPRSSLRGMRLTHLPSVGTKHLEALVHSLVCTLHAMRTAPDVIHYHAIGPSVMAVIPRLLGHRSAVVVTVHGMDQERAKWSRGARLALSLAAWLCGHVPDVTMAPSRAIVGHYQRVGSRPAVYVPHGTVRRAGRAPALVVEQFALVPRQYFLFVGRLVPEKKVDLLIDAFRDLAGHHQLVVVGGSSYTDSYVAELQRLAAADPRVILTGFAYGPLLEELYSNAHAFVSASGLEGVPLTVLEAASYGVPTVLSDIPGHVEVAGPDDAPGRRFFREGDRAGLVAALSRSLDAPEREREGAAALQSRVVAEYSWAEAARVTEQVYADAQLRRRPRRLPGVAPGAAAQR